MWETLAQPVWQSVTVALLHFLWQGCLIGAVLWVALRRLEARRVETRYMFSLLALGLMGLAPLLTYVVCSASTDTQHCFGQRIDERARASQRGQQLTPVPEGNSAPSAGGSLRPEQGPNDATRQQVSAWLASTQPCLLFGWLAGVGILGTRLAAGALGLGWLRRGRVDVRGPLAERARELGRRLGVQTAGRLFASARIAQAVALGYFRPIVVVPMSWMTELPQDVLEAVIAHELAHIRRWDLWVNLAQRLIETFLFYPPAAWWVSREVRRQRELCCDRLAVEATGRRAAYAQALESVARRMVRAPQIGLAASFTGDRNMFLLDRVQSVLGLRRSPLENRSWPVGLIALVFPLAVWLASIGLVPGHAPQALAQADGGRQARVRDGERRPADRPAEGNRGGLEGGERGGFQPQTPREAALMQMIIQLRQEMEQLRLELNQMRGNRQAVNPKARNLQLRKPVGRAGAMEPAAEGAEGMKPRDGEVPAKRGPREGDPAAGLKAGPRDGEGPAKLGPREGDPAAERKAGPREGDPGPAARR